MSEDAGRAPHDRQIAVYLTAQNVVSVELPIEGDVADTDGHVVTGTVLRRRGVDRTLVPVRARIAHGVAPQTAAAMLRKMADMVEADPNFLSGPPGTAVRRTPEGEHIRKHLTPEALLAAAEGLDEEDREKLLSMMGEIRLELTDPEQPRDTKPDDGML